jgi:hypothetical protein
MRGSTGKPEKRDRLLKRQLKRNATLQAVTAALSEALTPAQVAQVVVTQGRESAGCLRWLYCAHD